MTDNHWIKEIETIAARLTTELGDPQSNIVGCTDGEIAEIEADQAVPLPAVYRAFLQVMGRKGGSLERAECGAYIYYPEALGLRKAVDELLELNRWPFRLPRHARIFSMWQGYQFVYFADARQDNPELFAYAEGSPAPSSSKFLIEYLDNFVSRQVLLHPSDDKLSPKVEKYRDRVFFASNLHSRRLYLYHNANAEDYLRTMPERKHERLTRDIEWVPGLSMRSVWMSLLEQITRGETSLPTALATVGALNLSLDERTHQALTLAMLQFLLERHPVEAYLIATRSRHGTASAHLLMAEIEAVWQKSGVESALTYEIGFRLKQSA